MLKKVQDGNGGRWIVKKKFSFAAVALAIGTAFATRGIVLATAPEQIVVVLSAYGTFASWLLGLVFTADVVDKKLNNGSYE